MSDHAFSDLLEPRREETRDSKRLRESGLLAQLIARALAAVDGEAPKGASIPDHPCSECLKLTDQYPEYSVAEAESWIGFGERRYWGALCATCGDRLWTKRWSTSLEEARKKGHIDKVHALERAKHERQAKGRNVYA